MTLKGIIVIDSKSKSNSAFNNKRILIKDLSPDLLRERRAFYQIKIRRQSSAFSAKIPQNVTLHISLGVQPNMNMIYIFWTGDSSFLSSQTPSVLRWMTTLPESGSVGGFLAQLSSLFSFSFSLFSHACSGWVICSKVHIQWNLMGSFCF